MRRLHLDTGRGLSFIPSPEGARHSRICGFVAHAELSLPSDRADQIAAGVSGLVRLPRAPEQMHDHNGALRLIIPVPEISEILQSTIGHIAIYAAGDPFVMRRLYRVLDLVEPDLQEAAEKNAVASLRNQIQEKLRTRGAGSS